MGLLDFFRGKDTGFGIEELARRIGIPADLLQSIKPQYTEYKIAKRSGGVRIIHAPEPKLKEIQKLILRRVLGKLRAHPAVHGFERGRSIVTNAREHTGKAVVVHMDLKDFFTSTKTKRIEAYYRKIGWNREASRLLTVLSTHKGGLPQGAPTSPRLANLVNYEMDVRLAGLAAKAHTLPAFYELKPIDLSQNPVTKRRQSSRSDSWEQILRPSPAPNLRATYTRYADDISVSFTEDSSAAIRTLISFVHFILDEYDYAAHTRRKLRSRRKHQQQIVTGLIVNGPAPRLPREVRRRLRAIEHHQRTGKPATINPQQLAGWRAYEKMIETQGRAS